MFSSGQITFAILFFVSFVVILVISYRKDYKSQKTYYKGSFKILIIFILLIAFLFFFKTLTQTT